MSQEETKRTEISELGEFGLIEHLTRDSEIRHVSTVKGVGDDAAVLDQFSGNYTLVSSDMLIETIHFDLTYTPLAHLGYKAVIANISDIYAMNGIPKQVMVNIGVSNRFSVEALDELYSGIHIACKKYELDLVGGDTCSTRQGLVISITVIGETPEGRVVYRSGAKEGDLICVTGDLGGAYVGLQLLEREKEVFLSDNNMKPEFEGQDYIIGRQLKPEARKDIIEYLSDQELIPSSMIDISDGLASDLIHICKASGVGAGLREEDLPIHANTYNTAVKFNHDPTTTALSGGEDYELLFTISPQHQDIIEAHNDISIVGLIGPAEAGTKLLTKGGQVMDITAQGWNHFNEQEG